MFSSSHVFYGLSGLAAAAGGATAWWLIKENNRDEDNEMKKAEEIGKKVWKECGERLGEWWNEDNSHSKPDQENGRGKNLAEYNTCEEKILEEYKPS